jgi:hypothetical protein
MTLRTLWVKGTLRLIGAVLALLLAIAQANAAAGWSHPALVSPDNCFNPVAAIDGRGGLHMAADCGGWIRYWRQSGSSWSSTIFRAPSDRLDGDQQLAIDGNTLYLAFDRVYPNCCFIGVYYRSRTLPSGSWTGIKRLGHSGDRLHSFSAVRGRLHATVVGEAGRETYETNVSGTLRRYAIPGASPYAPSSLAVGNDNRARVAYEATSHTLRVARFVGNGFAWSTIPGTGRLDVTPTLVLDAQDRAHVVWEHRTDFEDLGITPAEHAADGTYYATNRSGSWTARRITRNIGDASLAVDVVSGRIHVLLGGEAGLKYYTTATGRSWAGITIDAEYSQDVSIRLRQATGRLFGVLGRVLDDGTGRVYAVAGP